MIKFGMFAMVWKWHDMTHRDESFHGQGDGLAQALHRRSYIGSSAVSTINYNVNNINNINKKNNLII